MGSFGGTKAAKPAADPSTYTYTTSSTSSGLTGVPAAHVQKQMVDLLEATGLRSFTCRVEYDPTVCVYRVRVEDAVSGITLGELIPSTVTDFTTMTHLAARIVKSVEMYRSVVMRPPSLKEPAFEEVEGRPLSFAELKEVRRMLAAFKKATEDAGQSQ